jgi:putative aldouronate transport system substrate-binding protein
MYRKDIFDKHGLKMWNSPETFYQTLKKLKELYPDSAPYTIKSGDGIFQSWSYSWGMKGQEPYYNEEDGKWYFTDIQPEYKEMLDFMLKCYNEGLIDPEFLTNTQAAWTAKMTQAEKAFVTTDWIGRMDAFKTQTATTVPDYDLRFANPIGPDQTLPETSQLCWARHVSSQSKNIETCFKLLDFTLSPAGKALITMGIEGETYEIGEDGMAKYLDPEYAGKTPTMSELQDKYGMYVQGMYLSFDRRCAYFNFTEREQEAQDYAKDPKHISPRDPELVFTEEENTKKNELIATFTKAGREFATKYILNNGGQKEWDAWVAQAEKLGYKELEKIYNDAQARYDAM